MGTRPAVRELAMGLFADTSTRIVYNQPTDQIPITERAAADRRRGRHARVPAQGMRAMEDRDTVRTGRPHGCCAAVWSGT